MPDVLTEAERRLIDEAVAAGRVTRCPTAHGFYEYGMTPREAINRQIRLGQASRGGALAAFRRRINAR